MSYKVKYFGVAKKGKLELHQEYKQPYHAAIWKLDGQEIEVTVTRKARSNTKPQMRYYRGVVVKMIAAEIGEDEKRAHEIIQAQFFEYEDTLGRKYIRSTELGEWTTVEWESKMDEIRAWALQFLNLVIPLPNEIDF
jgi:hypothetical protein